MKKKALCAAAALLICGAITLISPKAAWAAEDMEGPALSSGEYIATIDKTVNINKEHGSEEVLLQAQIGEKYQILEDMGDGWLRVQAGERTGYLPVDNNATVSVMSEEDRQAVEALVAAQSSKRPVVVQYALQFLGGRYSYGGNDPHTGVDCSGFTRYVMLHGAGVSLPRSSTSQSVAGVPVSAEQMRPGDLIFYGSGSRINHVAMYIGNGQIVHASTYETGIKISEWNYRAPIKIVNILGD